MPTIVSSGNCNFNYIDYLRGYENRPEQAMSEILTTPTVNSSYGYMSNRVAKPPVYRKPTCGMYLFAQGSEDITGTNPYGPNFKKYVETEGLGEVTEFRAANPLHAGKIGILYVWVINHDACLTWWNTNVMDPYKKSQEIKKEVEVVVPVPPIVAPLTVAVPLIAVPPPRKVVVKRLKNETKTS